MRRPHGRDRIQKRQELDEHEARRTATKSGALAKHMQRKCNASKRRRNTRGTSTAECRASDARRRRTSRRTSGTRWYTTARWMRKDCGSGQRRCSPRSRKQSANLKLKRASGWRQRTPTPNDAEHGRSSGKQEPSPHRHTFLRFNDDSMIAKRGRMKYLQQLNGATAILTVAPHACISRHAKYAFSSAAFIPQRTLQSRLKFSFSMTDSLECVYDNGHAANLPAVRRLHHHLQGLLRDQVVQRHDHLASPFRFALNRTVSVDID